MHHAPTDRPIHRRPLLLALAGSGAAALTGIGVAARTGLFASEDGGRDGVLRLSGGDPTVPSETLPLTEKELRGSAGKGAGTHSAQRETALFSMLGFTWQRGQSEPRIEVSPRVGGAWQPWRRVPTAHLPPDPSDDSPTVGTDVMWTGDADGVRLRLQGRPPAGLALVLLRPEPLAVDEDAAAPGGSASGDALALAAAPRRRTLKPELRRRRQWGANERWRRGSPSYNRAIKQVHVHHTVNSNDYRRRDVPAMIRGMYAYHTKSLGWSDIGYNFLVDRFGRIWVGRAGGARRSVRGAHTLGFNHKSTGVAVIGNFDEVAPNRAVLRAVASLAAWKLAMHGINPVAHISVVSEGSDRYGDGRRVRLPVIDGHRDTNQTACPGRHLYAALPQIRRRARRRIERHRRRR